MTKKILIIWLEEGIDKNKENIQYVASLLDINKNGNIDLRYSTIVDCIQLESKDWKKEKLCVIPFVGNSMSNEELINYVAELLTRSVNYITMLPESYTISLEELYGADKSDFG